MPLANGSEIAYARPGPAKIGGSGIAGAGHGGRAGTVDAGTVDGGTVVEGVVVVVAGALVVVEISVVVVAGASVVAVVGSVVAMTEMVVGISGVVIATVFGSSSLRPNANQAPVPRPSRTTTIAGSSHFGRPDCGSSACGSTVLTAAGVPGSPANGGGPSGD
jgi:hypothetical protein